MKKIKRFWHSIQEFQKTPYLLPMSALLISTAAILIAGFLFVPIYLAALTAIIFIGIATAIIRSHLRLALLETEQQLSVQQLRTVIHDMHEGVVLYTPQFKIISINPAAEQVLHVKESEVIGHTISPQSVNNKKLKLLSQVVFPSLAPVVSHISESGWPQVTEINTESPSLRLVLTLNRLTNEKGMVRAFVKLIQDKTHEQEIEESKAEFITTSAHQLRTPLTAMGWAFENLRTSLKDSPELQEVAAQGLGLSKRGLKIINDMLDVIQIEGGKVTYDLQTIDITHLVGTVIQEARNIAEEYGITINFTPPTESMLVSADESRISAVVATLIDNAIKYNTENGSVTVTVSTMNNRFVRLAVSDTGVGISPDEIEHIFKKFYRGKHAAQLEPNGTGLGLYIVKTVVEKHGGKVWVESVPGRGSTFYFTLPLAVKTSTPPAQGWSPPKADAPREHASGGKT